MTMSLEIFNKEEREIMNRESEAENLSVELNLFSSSHPLHPVEDKNIKRDLKAACRGSEDLLEQA